ncbi:MAG: lysophospholipid acyltransferase family protein [Candidatus Jettenia caeni]|nr:MAG: lysophospholipid acyltransferase family protein [Candidatus Jettenia caeni]
MIIPIKETCKLIVYRLIPYCFFYPFFKIFCRLEVKGIENLSSKEGILIASNHLSYIDPPLLATIIPRGCTFMAKHELFDIPVLKYIIRYYAFPVNRQNPTASSIKTAIHKLACGKKVVIFPEGRRNMGANDVSFKNGIAMTAVLSKKKVVPTLIEGTNKLFPKGTIIPRPAKLKITFGEPLDLHQVGAEYKKISQKIMEHITQQTTVKNFEELSSIASDRTIHKQ